MNKLSDLVAGDPDGIVHPMSRLLPKRPEGPMRAPARALGWFSIVLGTAELLMPRAVSHAAGMKGRGAALLRLHGLREIGVGIGLLTSRDPAPWLWGRVAGDAVDIATVSTGLVAGKPLRALGTLAMLSGVTAVDARCAEAAGRGPRQAVVDYSDRSGFPKPADEMRGAARDAVPAA